MGSILSKNYYSIIRSGDHIPIKGGFGGGGEILLGISTGSVTFGGGIGLEYFTKTKESDQRLYTRWYRDDPSFSDRTRNVKEDISTMGILAKGNISFEVAPQVAFFADIGIGLYMTKINYDLSWNGNYEYWDYGYYIDSNGYWRYGWFRYMYGDWTQSRNFEISKNRIGFTGGLGIEVYLSKNISFFGELKGRYLNLGEVVAKENYSYFDKWKYCRDYYDQRLLVYRIRPRKLDFRR